MPTAIGTANTASGSGWIGTADTKTIDGKAAVYNSVTATEWLKLSNFGLGPSGSINGIQVDSHGSGTCGDPTNRGMEIALSKDGGASIHGSTKTFTLDQTTDATETSGGAADLWGGSWTPAELASPLFCVLIKRQAAGAGQIRLDRVQVTVTYT